MVPSLLQLIYEMGSLKADTLGGYESSMTQNVLRGTMCYIRHLNKGKCIRLLLAVPTGTGGPGSRGRVGEGYGLWGHMAQGSSWREGQGMSHDTTGKAEFLGEGDHSFPTAFSLQKAYGLQGPCR